MSTQTLSRVTLETLANVRTAATQVVAAYGAGSRRLVKTVDGTVQHQVVPVTMRLVPAAGERLDTVRGTVSRAVDKSIVEAVARSEQLIGRSSDFAVAQLERWTDRVADIDNGMVVQGLDAAARLSLPAAQLARVVTGKVAEGATSLADAAGAHPLAAPARKAAKTATRRARQAAAKAPRAAKKPAAKAVRSRRAAA